jgi:hypothetical protein
VEPCTGDLEGRLTLASFVALAWRRLVCDCSACEFVEGIDAPETGGVQPEVSASASVSQTSLSSAVPKRLSTRLRPQQRCLASGSVAQCAGGAQHDLAHRGVALAGDHVEVAGDRGGPCPRRPRCSRQDGLWPEGGGVRATVGDQAKACASRASGESSTLGGSLGARTPILCGGEQSRLGVLRRRRGHGRREPGRAGGAWWSRCAG